jgi:hypothetical protein
VYIYTKSTKKRPLDSFAERSLAPYSAYSASLGSGKIRGELQSQSIIVAVECHTFDAELLATLLELGGAKRRRS